MSPRVGRPRVWLRRGAAAAVGLGLGGAVVLGALTSATAATFRPAQVVQPVTGTSVHTAVEPVAVTPPEPTGPVVVLGDSVAAGSACGCTPYGTLLARSLADRTRQPVSVANEGTDGLTSAGLVDQVGSTSVQHALSTAGVVTVTIGANDFDAGIAGDSDCAGDEGCYAATLVTMSANVQAVLQKIDGLVPASAKILVTGYWNVFLDGAVGRTHGTTYVVNSDALTRRVNAAIQSDAAAAHAIYVDEYGPFESGSLASLTARLAPDGDHPSAAGHALIAKLLLAAL